MSVGIRVCTLIDAPQSRVWEIVEAIEHHTDWMTDAARITFVTPSTRGIGTAFDCLTRVGPLRLNDRMKVIEALETGISMDAPSGKVTIDPATHHCVLDVHIAEVADKKLKVLEDFAQQKPADTAAVCNLIKNPNDNQQYVIKI